MNSEGISAYLNNPNQIENALKLIESMSDTLPFEKLFINFQNALGINYGETFPIVPITINGYFCRGRKNNDDFKIANFVSQIGVKPCNASQGRANAENYSIFYAANSRQTAVIEILQNEPNGMYEVTIGCWRSKNGLYIANFVNADDSDFDSIAFAHSKPFDYLKEFTGKPRESMALILNYFNTKYKEINSPGLYNVTNVIAAICFSLEGVDGIGYGSTSNKYRGYNIALKDPSKVYCTSAEQWGIIKSEDDKYTSMKLKDGIINENQTITWFDFLPRK